MKESALLRLNWTGCLVSRAYEIQMAMMHSLYRRRCLSTKLYFIASCFVVVNLIIYASPVAVADLPDVTIGKNFLATDLNETGETVPDTMGTVGSDHVVLMINGRYKAWDKYDSDACEANENEVCLLENESLGIFWTEPGKIVPLDTFDPRVVYDPYEQRYVAAVSYRRRMPNDFLIARSNTSSALLTDGWKRFAVDSDTDDGQYLDFPMLGVTADSVVIGGNMKSLGDEHGNEVAVLAIDKDAFFDGNIVAGTLPTNTYKLFEDQLGVTGQLPHPVMDLDNSTESPALLTAGKDFVKHTEVVSFTDDDLDDVRDVFLPSRSPAPNGDQPNPTPGQTNPIMDLFNINGINSPLPHLLSSHAVRQGGYHWGVQGRLDASSGNAAIRWFQLDAVDETVESNTNEGVRSDSDLDLIYPSIAVNKFGDIVIGMTATGEGAGDYPGSYAVVGKVDSENNVTFGDLRELQEGVSTFDRGDGSRPISNRWGDYTATVVDPVNPLHFWTFQQFVKSQDVWGIQITQLIIGDDLPADMDVDGDVDLDDVNPFLLALVDEDDYFDVYGARGAGHVNLDGDRDFDVDDVDPFVVILNAGGSGSHAGVSGPEVSPVPEPHSLSIIVASVLAMVCRRPQKQVVHG